MFVYIISISHFFKTARVAHCVIVGSIFDANQQNKTRLVNLFYYRDVIAIGKQKTWAPCDIKRRSTTSVANLVVIRTFSGDANWKKNTV